VNIPKIVRQIKKDVRVFGPHILKVGVGWMIGTTAVKTRLRGSGEVTIRPMDSDLETFRQVYTQEQYEVPTLNQRQRLDRYYDQLLEHGTTPLIIDAGANIGAAALWFSERYPKSRIVAIEPDAKSAALCRSNTAERPNVTVVEGAIGGSPGNVTVADTGKSWAVTTRRTELPSDLKVHTVRDLQRRVEGRTALFLVKVDIEGFEADLFEHSAEWVAETAAIFVEVHDWLFPNKQTSQSMQKALLGQGFEILVRGENLMFIREANELDRMAALRKQASSGLEAHRRQP
jgi:FkbM family methyltransferase